MGTAQTFRYYWIYRRFDLLRFAVKPVMLGQGQPSWAMQHDVDVRTLVMASRAIFARPAPRKLAATGACPTAREFHQTASCFCGSRIGQPSAAPVYRHKQIEWEVNVDGVSCGGKGGLAVAGGISIHAEGRRFDSIGNSERLGVNIAEVRQI